MIIYISNHVPDARWHPWFAWSPVWVGRELRWLEWVERRLTACHDDYIAEYRLLDLENYP